jgi:zinc/manganese transport system substrate-binding protein
MRSCYWAAVLLAVSFPAYANLNVVTTVPDLAALAKEVGGKDVNVTSMSAATQDPHFVDARPSLAVQLNKADLLLAIGLQLEIGWLPTLVNGARNPKIQRGAAGFLEVSTLVALKDVPQQAIDRSMGDIHPGGNPHFLSDPREAAKVAQGISERLSHLDPAHAADFSANTQAFLAKLDTARKGWEQRMAPFKGTQFIGYHRTWPYFCDWLGLQTVEFVEPKPGIPPNPTHVVHVLSVARSKKVPLILQETYYPDASSKIIAEKAGATLLRVSGGTQFQAGQSYIQHMDEIITALQGALANKAPSK